MLEPTLEFRWALIPLSQLDWDHPSAFCHAAHQRAQVLQQKWVSDLVGVDEEWRDIPMVEVMP